MGSFVIALVGDTVGSPLGDAAEIVGEVDKRDDTDGIGVSRAGGVVVGGMVAGVGSCVGSGVGNGFGAKDGIVVCTAGAFVTSLPP